LSCQLLIFVGISVLFATLIALITSQSTDGGFRYKYIGCFHDEGGKPNRALPLRYFNAKKYVNWKLEDYNFKKVIDLCAAHARNRSDVSLFGVQYYGECWGGKAGSNYRRHGKSKNCMQLPGVPGMGKGWTNAVYELICKCYVACLFFLKLFKPGDGDKFLVLDLCALFSG